MTYGGEEMDRRDKGHWPPQPRSETAQALRGLGSAAAAAVVVLALQSAWVLLRMFGVIS